MTSRRAAPAAVRWTAYIGIAIVFAIACAFLSHWQFSRNADRSRQLELVSVNYNQDAVPLDELIPEGSSMAPGDEWRPITLTGTYLADEQILARNRAHGGTSAFEVLVPLRMQDGRVIIVDRGWVPPGNSVQTPDEVPEPPTGTVTVIARLQDGEPLPASGRGAPAGQVPTIHLPLIAQQMGDEGTRLETSAYALMVSEDPAPAVAPQQLESPSDDPGPYLSYAVQWILFAAMGFIFIWYVIRTERRHRREEEEDAAAALRAQAEGPAAAAAFVPRVRRSGRRQDSDMQDEDALLDRASR